MSVFDQAFLGPEAESVAAAAALRLADRGGAVVVSDGLGAALPLGAPAFPAARRLARSFSGEHVRAAARGRLTFVWPEREVLVATARRVAARTPDPVVLALAAPRDELADVLLAESLDVVVVADPGGGIAALALAELAEIGVLASALPAERIAGRSLARLGWRAPAWLGRSARAAWEGG